MIMMMFEFNRISQRSTGHSDSPHKRALLQNHHLPILIMMINWWWWWFETVMLGEWNCENWLTRWHVLRNKQHRRRGLFQFVHKKSTTKISPPPTVPAICNWKSCVHKGSGANLHSTTHSNCCLKLPKKGQRILLATRKKIFNFLLCQEIAFLKLLLLNSAFPWQLDSKWYQTSEKNLKDFGFLWRVLRPCFK